MASMQNGANLPAPSYSKMLLLGAIAAASAFVVTILIVLLCVGCQRKGKTKNVPTDAEKHKDMNMSVLRQSKLRSMSKSDTRLHEMSRQACNGKSVSKNRPASMDLLLLPSRGSSADLHCPQGRQLPLIPPTPGDDREHTYSEVGHRASPPRPPDDALYEIVGGRASESDTPTVLPPQSASPVYGNSKVDGLGKGTNGKGNNGVPVTAPVAAPQDPVTAEYASIRKFRKVDKAQRKENGASMELEQQCYSNVDLRPATPPPQPRSHEIPRKTKEAFHIHSFPKEMVFMGNGEQYIWKPPEDDDVSMLQHQPPLNTPPGENGQGHTAEEIAEMYSKVCKPTKKKRPPTSPPVTQESNGQRNLPRPAGGHPLEDPCYESIGEKTFSGGAEESDPAYETIDTNWKRDRPPNATLKHTKNKPQQQQHLPVRALPSENFYESISDVKQGVPSSSTTTIFTFNDGMEMYVTGL